MVPNHKIRIFIFFKKEKGNKTYEQGGIPSTPNEGKNKDNRTSIYAWTGDWLAWTFWLLILTGLFRGRNQAKVTIQQ